MGFSLESVKNFTQSHDNFTIYQWEYNDIEPPFDIKPKDFLNLAQNHLKNDNLIDAISNIKRCIDCQLDTLLFGFGAHERSKNERWNFPKKSLILEKNRYNFTSDT
jgi:hypothetical protein